MDMKHVASRKRQNEGGLCMTTRQAMDDFIQRCENVIRAAKDQINESARQEFYNNGEYVFAQTQIEETLNDLAHLALNANAQQREQLHRMRLQLQQLQNQMILT